MERELEMQLNHGDSPNIVVLGDVMVDRHVHCEVLGISPEDDLAPKVRILYENSSLGGAANVAVNLKKLGANAILVGQAGTDEHADWLKMKLNVNEVGAVIRHDSGLPTTVKTRYLTPRGKHIIRVDKEKVDASDLFEAWFNELNIWDDVDAVVVSDYAKGVVSSKVMDRLRDRVACPIIVDPKRDIAEYGRVQTVTPNQAEFDQYVRWGNFTCADSIVITKGDKGCTLWNAGKNTIDYPVRGRAMGDPTGCGDSFVAAFAFAVTRGLPLAVACQVANAAGAVKFDHHGTYAVSVKEIVDELDKQREESR